MRLISSALCTTVAVALLAGCSGMSQTTPSAPSSTGQTQSRFDHGKYKPHWAYPASLIPHLGAPPRYREVLQRFAKKHGNDGGIYATEFLGTSAFGYQHVNTGNNPPECSVGPVSYINGVAVDGKGNLIDPDGGTRSVIVFSGPGMCGSEAGYVLRSVRSAVRRFERRRGERNDCRR